VHTDLLAHLRRQGDEDHRLAEVFMLVAVFVERHDTKLLQARELPALHIAPHLGRDVLKSDLRTPDGVIVDHHATYENADHYGSHHLQDNHHQDVVVGRRYGRPKARREENGDGSQQTDQILTICRLLPEIEYVYPVTVGGTFRPRCCHERR